MKRNLVFSIPFVCFSIGVMNACGGSLSVKSVQANSVKETTKPAGGHSNTDTATDASIIIPTVDSTLDSKLRPTVKPVITAIPAPTVASTPIVNVVYKNSYYVSSSGLDTNSGTSPSTALKTIKKGISKAVSGDVVYVMTGTYSEVIYISQSNIALMAYPNNAPVIDGGTTLPNSDWGALITLGGNNNKLSGFEIKNCNSIGARIGGFGIKVSGHHNLVSSVNVHHVWENGIDISGDYNTVEDSMIWQSSRRSMGTSATSGWAGGISAARNDSSAALKPGITSYATFRRNKVFNNWGEGLSCFEADYCVMEDNIVYDNWTINLYISDTSNSLVQRNLVYVSSSPAIATRNNSKPSGITLADEVSSVPRSANNKVVNNFIYNTGMSAFSWTEVSGSGLVNVIIANNTIIGGGLSTGSINSNSQIRNNILGSGTSVSNKTGLAFSNNIVGDAQITKTGSTAPGSLSGEYFKLLSGSPAIDAAMPLVGVTVDFFGTSRDSKPDIGAHEFK